MRSAIAPFSKADEESIKFSRPWHVQTGGPEVPLGENIEVWDYMTELGLSAELSVNLDQVRLSTHQGESANFKLVVSASSSSTRMRGPIWKSESLGGEAMISVDVEACLGGFELGGRLDLTTTLVLLQPDPIDEIGASLKGSVLWQHRHQTFLEGNGPQFPTEGADLSAAPYLTPRAGWRLEFDLEDLDSAAGAAIRLLVNESDPTIVAMRQGLDSPDVTAMIRTMRWDVARQLIWACLDSDEFLQRSGSFEDETVGWVLTNILNRHFGGDAPSSIRAIRDASPAEFESRLQDASGLLG